MTTLLGEQTAIRYTHVLRTFSNFTSEFSYILWYSFTLRQLN